MPNCNDQARSNLVVSIQDAVMRRTRALAALEGRGLGDLVQEALEQYLERRQDDLEVMVRPLKK